MDLQRSAKAARCSMIRGGIAFLVGIAVSNNPSMSATVLVFACGRVGAR